MDFFSQVRDSSQNPAYVPSLSTPPHVPEDFAQAVGTRHAPALTARLDTATPVLTHPLASLSLSSPPPQRSAQRLGGLLPPAQHQQSLASTSSPSEFTPLTAFELAAALETPNTLVLDIRPHASYSVARLPHSISLSVPSTLLKRPAFSLQKLSTMMRPGSRTRFLTWRTASNIIVYDADTSTLTEGNNILGLLRKFKAEGFQGSIAWVRGGFTAAWKEARGIIIDAPLSDSSDEEVEDGKSSPGTGGALLQARNLPMSAFQQATTTSAARPTASVPVGPTHAGAAPLASTRVVAANAFYDNIRQNVELAQGVTERIPLDLPSHITSRAADLPFEWLRDIVTREKDDAADLLAMQFYKIELREQRRLQGIMNHHTQNAFSSVRDDFPYSITAGIEKGSKNRYRDIWPFEHSRVRLRASAEDGSDYVNASFICPLGTRRRYIATQGPLPTTYTDFWTLCWEQNVAVIVMLTRQVEGANVKSGNYWVKEQYGPLHLQTVSVEGHAEEAERSVPGGSGFDFGSQAPSPLPAPPRFSPSKNVIQRKFYLTHDDFPDRPPRLVTQLQYLAWPDVNVPDTPDGLLWLINAVDRAMVDAKQAANIADPDEDPGPVLLHCSAGVGRTGGFIVVDAVLDALRREMRKQRSPSASPMEVRMDVDNDPSSSDPSQDEPSPSAQPATDPPPSARGPLARGLVAATSPLHSRLRHGAALDSVSRKLVSRHTNPLAPRPVSSHSGSSVKIPGPADDVTSSSSRHESGLFESQEGITSASSLDLDPSPSPAKDAHGSEQDEYAEADPKMTPQVRLQPSKNYFEVVEVQRSGPVNETHSTSAFDYAPPRFYGAQDDSPPPLSEMAEPIRELLEDMRQQRMSLCQTLRQYIFVHRAIIEGALALVDERRAAAEQSSSSKAPSSVAAPRAGSQGLSISKSSSLKRKQRTTPDEHPENQRDKASHAASLTSMRT
ncbi:hypothetical protein EXIGLDRAFT_744852 [Exidia glandulosa HHB12029]|uniref:protein-tyrosine-phosphatase n=1 Tax=Exidia glandulosa HHB12029 TaxID=1314781 RepID=A0A165PG12_EXIGL|nr:hypothetical protein EXIGLDRAFT_744852 [Exidia glandulosa HHB12029]